MFRRPWAFAGTVSLLSMVLALSGCAVGPDFVKPEAKIQENWSEKGDSRVATQTAVASQWWKAFNDPTLDQLIKLAYQQNLPLQITGLRILEARARLGLAIGQQFPQQQELFGSASKENFSGNAPNSSFRDKNYRNYQAGFDAVWELDFWGKFRRDVQSAHAGLIASEADYDNALVSLTAEVARTYTAIRTFEMLIELTRGNVKLQEEGLMIAESRFRHGVVTELDVAQSRTLLENTRASVPQMQSGQRQAENALSTLLGEPPGAIQTFLNGQKGIPVAPAEVAVSVPAELLRRRPDIRSAELSAAAQCARIGIAKADLYPKFSLFGEIGFQSSGQGGFQSNHAHFDNIFDSASLFYSFGPSVQWPFFNYGRIKNNVRVQDARFQQLIVNYKNTVLRAAQESEDALIGFLKAQEAATFTQNSVNAARRSVEIALVQYREGAVDYQRVLDTQRVLLQEEIRLTETRSSIATNLIALYKALGGGWELRQNQPIVAVSTLTEMQKRTNWGRLLSLPSPKPEDLQPLPTRNVPVPYW
ncbi:MAG: efflux transporter outer membrane subunit [Candidatus Brocadia sp. BROELEC01]|nr:efflux transporter outer membrane subunit [Candidatus Brocadia sapporoensis]QQR68167.1 MAG: efflux transporter outer membrane subunit [Candidatus Brocadia sp.]RZV57412.1 MAG: efflux transporter outer membrane subunit [Candidatus Brocadia sp. BROELEC01]